MVAYQYEKNLALQRPLHHACRFQEQHVLVFSYRAPYLNKHKIRLVFLAYSFYTINHFKRNVSNYFHALASVFKVTFPCDNRLIHPACGEIVEGAEVLI